MLKSCNFDLNVKVSRPLPSQQLAIVKVSHTDSISSRLEQSDSLREQMSIKGDMQIRCFTCWIPRCLLSSSAACLVASPTAPSLLLVSMPCSSCRVSSGKPRLPSSSFCSIPFPPSDATVPQIYTIPAKIGHDCGTNGQTIRSNAKCSNMHEDGAHLVRCMISLALRRSQLWLVRGLPPVCRLLEMAFRHRGGRMLGWICGWVEGWAQGWTPGRLVCGGRCPQLQHLLAHDAPDLAVPVSAGVLVLCLIWLRCMRWTPRAAVPPLPRTCLR